MTLEIAALVGMGAVLLFGFVAGKDKETDPAHGHHA